VKGKDGGIKTFVMPDDLWMALREQALRERTSASEIIRRLVAGYLKVKRGRK